MKKTLLYFLTALLSGFSTYGQVNLVLNPSFEEKTGCVFLDDDCNDWFTFKGTPDYINGCNYSTYDNGAGFQLPHSGEAYAGFINYHNQLHNVREHLGVELISPLIIGQKYFVSFYVSSGYKTNSFNVSTNNIGALFTTYTYYDFMGDSPNLNFSHINETSIISDTVNWKKISGSFIADSAYQYLIIGNFYDVIHTDTLVFPDQIAASRSYYFIDDVCLSTDSLYAHNWTTLSIPKQPDNNLLIYPNPIRDYFQISANLPINKIILYDYMGNLVMLKEIESSKVEIIINLNDISSGVYFIHIETVNSTINRKIIINKN